jgi:SAM-dependent methyltransferase
MHTGWAYHNFMLASTRDLKVRKRFQRLARSLAPLGGTILDFGAGTGIDAKSYAEIGYKVLVYEPTEENRACVAGYCRDEIAGGRIVISDLATNDTAQLITADFAVLNLVADPRTLFSAFARVLAPDGRVLVSLLNPFFVGDARYPWWRENLRGLLKRGTYVVNGKNGPVYRFTPRFVARSAQPAFHQIGIRPCGPALAASRYMFMAFQKT